MENLNAEQVKKALENWVKNYDGNALDFTIICNALILISWQEQRIKELTEENEKLMSASSLQGAIIGSLQVAANELTTDKERLEKMLDDKCDRCIERERADTARAMQERFKAEVIRRYQDIAYRDLFFGVIDQIATEMLEGKE